MFVRVFSAPTVFEAHFVRSLLESQGVLVRITNEIFAYGVPVELWVHADDVRVAAEVVEEVHRIREEDGALSFPDGNAGEISLPEGDEEP